MLFLLLVFILVVVFCAVPLALCVILNVKGKN